MKRCRRAHPREHEGRCRPALHQRRVIRHLRNRPGRRPPRRRERPVPRPALPRKEERVLARSWLIAPPGSATQAGGATIAFLESDRRDLPVADERNGDIPIARGVAADSSCGADGAPNADLALRRRSRTSLHAVATAPLSAASGTSDAGASLAGRWASDSNLEVPAKRRLTAISPHSRDVGQRGNGGPVPRPPSRPALGRVERSVGGLGCLAARPGRRARRCARVAARCRRT